MWRSLRNLFHLIRLVLTLARHGALFLMERLPHAPALGVIARVAHALLRRREALKLREGERLSQALEALGPSHRPTLAAMDDSHPVSFPWNGVGKTQLQAISELSPGDGIAAPRSRTHLKSLVAFFSSHRFP